MNVFLNDPVDLIEVNEKWFLENKKTSVNTTSLKLDIKNTHNWRYTNNVVNMAIRHKSTYRVSKITLEVVSKGRPTDIFLYFSEVCSIKFHLDTR